MKKSVLLIPVIAFILTSCVVENKYLFHKNGENYWVSIEEYYELKYQRGLILHEENPNICPSPKDYAERWTRLTKDKGKPKKVLRLSIFRKK
jgi:hypothetical protein